MLRLEVMCGCWMIDTNVVKGVQCCMYSGGGASKASGSQGVQC